MFSLDLENKLKPLIYTINKQAKVLLILSNPQKLFFLKYKSECEIIIPTFEILKAFTSTNYVDSIQLSLISHIPNIQQIDQFYKHLNHLLIEHSQNFIEQQKNYLLTSQIQDVLKNVDSQEQNQTKIDVLYLTLTVLYDQLDFIQNQNLIQIDEEPTFVKLLKEFPIYKQVYKEINQQFREQVQASINNFNDSQRTLIFALVILSFIISVVSLIAYYNYK